MYYATNGCSGCSLKCITPINEKKLYLNFKTCSSETIWFIPITQTELLSILSLLSFGLCLQEIELSIC